MLPISREGHESNLGRPFDFQAKDPPIRRLRGKVLAMVGIAKAKDNVILGFGRAEAQIPPQLTHFQIDFEECRLRRFSQEWMNLECLPNDSTGLSFLRPSGSHSRIVFLSRRAFRAFWIIY